MQAVSIIGCGFVADLYMRSLQCHPDVQVASVYDRDPARAKAFGAHWKTQVLTDEAAFFASLAPGSLVLNLTNPKSHYAINHASLSAGHHVYSEKPLALQMDQARALHDLAAEKSLMLASAPCSVLGEAAQMMGKALRDGIAGRPRVIYAELDDGFIPQAPYQGWLSASGAPWPAVDEFQVGCTLEHAGYYLSWLISWFGSVTRVVAASTHTMADLLPEGSAPDTSVACLFFENGPMVRLTCSISAPHDHRLRVICDNGVLELKETWDNSARVRFKRRLRIRRRLVDMPVGKRLPCPSVTHPKVPRWGAAEMNFALGPVEMLDALREGRGCRLSSDFALHLNEVTLAIQNAGEAGTTAQMTTTCPPMEPMPWAK